MIRTHLLQFRESAQLLNTRSTVHSERREREREKTMVVSKCGVVAFKSHLAQFSASHMKTSSPPEHIVQYI